MSRHSNDVFQEIRIDGTRLFHNSPVLELNVPQGKSQIMQLDPRMIRPAGVAGKVQLVQLPVQYTNVKALKRGFGRWLKRSQKYKYSVALYYNMIEVSKGVQPEAASVATPVVRPRMLAIGTDDLGSYYSVQNHVVKEYLVHKLLGEYPLANV